jgi:hypothetical protein
MKVTQADYAFWSAKRAPHWAASFASKQQQSSGAGGVHHCINARARTRGVEQFELDAGNLLAIIRMVRARGANLQDYLRQMARVPGTVIRPERRAGYARKWLRRLEAPSA